MWGGKLKEKIYEVELAEAFMNLMLQACKQSVFIYCSCFNIVKMKMKKISSSGVHELVLLENKSNTKNKEISLSCHHSTV